LRAGGGEGRVLFLSLLQVQPAVDCLDQVGAAVRDRHVLDLVLLELVNVRLVRNALRVQAGADEEVFAGGVGLSVIIARAKTSKEEKRDKTSYWVFIWKKR
jgi:hypothetical protein